jgi:polysaccharide biosynthesis transport protein
MDKSVRTPRDVPRVPVLGTIPNADDDEVEIPRVETACLDVPHSIMAEAFRNLRANLFFSAPAEQQGVILVTSAGAGHGKTAVAANLAISIALSGRRVLLIDANFRRPAMPRIFAASGTRSEGLSNILIGQGKLAELVSNTGVPGCDVLAAGPTPPNPAELLGSSYLRDLIVDARAQYDQVIVDGPPVLLVSDAIVLAGAVDGVLLVCQYRSTSRGAFQRTQAQLEAINARIFGAVLNKVETRAGGYFRKVYREFYQYQEPEEGAALTALPGGAAAAQPKPPAELEQPGAGEKTSPPQVPPSPPGATTGPGAEIDAKAPGTAMPPPMNIDEEIRKLGSDAAIDLGDEFKIDDDFDLGEDLDRPRK